MKDASSIAAALETSPRNEARRTSDEEKATLQKDGKVPRRMEMTIVTMTTILITSIEISQSSTCNRFFYNHAGGGNTATINKQ